MPELPEVENVGRALKDNLQGQVLTGLQVNFAGVLGSERRAWAAMDVISKLYLSKRRLMSKGLSSRLTAASKMPPPKSPPGCESVISAQWNPISDMRFN